ncbi:MAG: NAD(+)/NADH kinase [Planctomycetota bacterium]
MADSKPKRAAASSAPAAAASSSAQRTSTTAPVVRGERGERMGANGAKDPGGLNAAPRVPLGGGGGTRAAAGSGIRVAAGELPISPMGKVERVLLVAHPGKPAALEMARSLTPWLKKRCEVVGLVVDLESELSNIDADLVIAFGGDGLILSMARRMGLHQKPVVGVNLGALGFLAEIAPDHAKEQLTRVFHGEGRISHRMMLRVKRIRPGLGGAESGMVMYDTFGLNDAFVHRGNFGRIVKLEISVLPEVIAQVRGDGVIVATPTGSTGYNLSAGGPIMAIHTNALVVTPICPHGAHNRPVVISDREALTLRVLQAGESCRLFVDGQIPIELSANDEVHITRSEVDFMMLEVATHGRYGLMRKKLGWM